MPVAPAKPRGLHCLGTALQKQVASRNQYGGTTRRHPTNETTTCTNQQAAATTGLEHPKPTAAAHTNERTSDANALQNKRRPRRASGLHNTKQASERSIQTSKQHKTRQASCKNNDKRATRNNEQASCTKNNERKNERATQSSDVEISSVLHWEQCSTQSSDNINDMQATASDSLVASVADGRSRCRRLGLGPPWLWGGVTQPQNYKRFCRVKVAIGVATTVRIVLPCYRTCCLHRALKDA
jgi:hypothetical protein